MIPAVWECCAGIDVGKKLIVVCVLKGPANGDAPWLAHLLRHGMIRSSYIPPKDIRELRDLTRRRRQLVRNGAPERNRVQKVLEGAPIKLGNVLTDVFGLSGQRMVEALLEGKASAEEIAQLAQKSAKKKIPQGHRSKAIG